MDLQQTTAQQQGCSYGATTHHCLNFQQKLRLDETIDHQQRVRWIRRAFEQLREKRGPQFYELIQVLRIHQVSRELYYVIEIAADAFEYIPKISKHLTKLCREVIFAGDAAATDNWPATNSKGPSLTFPIWEYRP